jgi:hypothetical protein
MDSQQPHLAGEVPLVKSQKPSTGLEPRIKSRFKKGRLIQARLCMKMPAAFRWRAVFPSACGWLGTPCGILELKQAYCFLNTLNVNEW